MGIDPPCTGAVYLRIWRNIEERAVTFIWATQRDLVGQCGEMECWNRWKVDLILQFRILYSM